MDVISVYERYKPFFTFFIGIFLGGLFLYWFIHTDFHIPFLQRVVARLCAFFLNHMGLNTEVYETVVVSQKPLPLHNFTVLLTQNGFIYLSKKPVSVPYDYSPATLVVEDTFFVDIVKECTGLLGFFLIATLILSYPGASWRKKLLGLILGFMYAFTINIVRITTAVYLGYLYGNFEFIHTVLWRIFSVFLILLFWIMWLRWSGDNKKKNTHN